MRRAGIAPKEPPSKSSHASEAPVAPHPCCPPAAWRTTGACRLPCAGEAAPVTAGATTRRGPSRGLEQPAPAPEPRWPRHAALAKGKALAHPSQPTAAAAAEYHTHVSQSDHTPAAELSAGVTSPRRTDGFGRGSGCGRGFRPPEGGTLGGSAGGPPPPRRSMARPPWWLEGGSTGLSGAFWLGAEADLPVMEAVPHTDAS